MYRDFLAMEHYRLHVMEQWPDGPAKSAGLAAVRATIASLTATPPAGAPWFECDLCRTPHVAKIIRLRPQNPGNPVRKAA